MKKSEVKKYVETAITHLIGEYEKTIDKVSKSKNRYKDQLTDYYKERVEMLSREMDEVMNNFNIEED